jgi:hypothetical protein
MTTDDDCDHPGARSMARWMADTLLEPSAHPAAVRCRSRRLGDRREVADALIGRLGSSTGSDRANVLAALAAVGDAGLIALQVRLIRARRPALAAGAARDLVAVARRSPRSSGRAPSAICPKRRCGSTAGRGPTRSRPSWRR